MKLILFFFIFFTGLTASAQNEFQGFFVGLDINYHYLFGGAQVESRETIGDGIRPAIGIMTGYRWHFDNDLIFGVEVQLNQPIGSFENVNNPANAIVNYLIRPQSAMQFQFGKVLDADAQHLLLGYFAFNQTRFNIDITMPDGSEFKQTDFENFGRVGLGYENRFVEHWSMRMQVGSSMDALPDTKNLLDTKLNFLYTF
jgi:hypothetical protein